MMSHEYHDQALGTGHWPLTTDHCWICWKGKPIAGDGSRLENGRAETCLEGSTPSPSAATDGPVGNRQTTLAQTEGCCGFKSHLGHCWSLRNALAVPAW